MSRNGTFDFSRQYILETQEPGSNEQILTFSLLLRKDFYLPQSLEAFLAGFCGIYPLRFLLRESSIVAACSSSGLQDFAALYGIVDA